MRTLFVSASDTNVGKTYVSAVLCQYLGKEGCNVQYVKPVETGVIECGMDAKFVRENCQAVNLTTHTLTHYKEPLAPNTAAKLEGRTVGYSHLIEKLHELPECDWRVVEGAGGIAVPIGEEGHDWASFAHDIKADYTLLVVPNRLGAIHQARVTHAYAMQHSLQGGIILNECIPMDSFIIESNNEGLEQTGCPIWGSIAYNTPEIVFSSLFPLS